MPEALQSPNPVDDHRSEVVAPPDAGRASRRGLLRGLGLGGAGAVAVFLSACGSDDSSDDTSEPAASTSASPSSETSGAATKKNLKIAGTGDLQIVNYALTLEYLEADFYAQVIASGVVKDKKIADLAKEFGAQEEEHVQALLKTARSLGKPVSKPRTNFDGVLSAGPDKILQTAAVVENLGAAAYLGQAGRIEDEDILAAALSIHSVEARHAAALNQAAGRPLVGSGGLDGSIPDGPFATPLSMSAVLERVQPFLA